MVDLAAFFVGDYPAGLPRWLALRKGPAQDQPAAGGLSASGIAWRSSSVANCPVLPPSAAPDLPQFSSPADLHGWEIGEVKLAFIPDHAYALFSGEAINPGQGIGCGRCDTGTPARRDVRLRPGVDAADRRQTTGEIPGEVWQLVDGIALRPQPDPSAAASPPA